MNKWKNSALSKKNITCMNKWINNALGKNITNMNKWHKVRMIYKNNITNIWINE